MVERRANARRIHIAGLGPGLTVDRQLQWIRSLIGRLPVHHKVVEPVLLPGVDGVDAPSQHVGSASHQKRDLDPQRGALGEPAPLERVDELREFLRRRGRLGLQLLQRGGQQEPLLQPLVEARSHPGS